MNALPPSAMKAGMPAARRGAGAFRIGGGTEETDTAFATFANKTNIIVTTTARMIARITTFLLIMLRIVIDLTFRQADSSA
jgi:hypothetical protein